MISIKKFLPRTLMGRSLMILVTPVLLIQVISTFFFFDRHWSKVTSRLAFAVAGEVAVIVATIKDAQGPEEMQRIANYALDDLDLRVTYQIAGVLPKEDRFSAVDIWEEVVVRKLLRELNRKIDEPITVHSDFSEKTIQVFVGLDKGLLTVDFPLRRLFSSSGYIFLLWMIGSSLMLLIIAILFMRNQVRPIRKLAAVAERFGKGRDAPYFMPEGAREVRQAGEAFLDMRRRIERQVTQRTAMLAGVSHDLRTPLTRLKLEMEMLPQGTDREGMRQDIADMERMIGGYLDFVRGDGDESYERVEVLGVFEKLSAALKRERDVEVWLDIEGSVALKARPLAFERAMNNLMSNAGKYADEIWVRAFLDGERVQIEIDDNGPGVPPTQFEEVFKPFMRVDDSRNSDTGGVGLGLPIVMDIVHAHGGKVWLEESLRGGLRVIVRMPI